MWNSGATRPRWIRLGQVLPFLGVRKLDTLKGLETVFHDLLACLRLCDTEVDPWPSRPQRARDAAMKMNGIPGSNVVQRGVRT